MRKLLCGVLALVLATAGLAATDPFKDPLDLPAMPLKRQLTTTQLSASPMPGSAVVAVSGGVGTLTL